MDPPPLAHLHSHTLKPELQEVVLRSIMSGQTNYSPFEKCTFFSSPIFSSSPSPPSLSSSPHLLFSFQALQRGTVKETKSFATCVISKWAAFRLKTSCCCGCTGPEIPGNILLRCSLKTCGIPAHSIPTTLLWNFLNGWKAGLFELFWKVKHRPSLSLHGCVILLYKPNCEKAGGENKKDHFVLVLWE